MTAIRVVDAHEELSGIGQLTHAQIDSHVSGTSFLVVSGTVPPQGRIIAAGTGIKITDEGPGGNLVISTTTSTALSGTLISWMETPSGATDDVNTLFNVSNVPLPSSSLMLFVNGVLQKQGPSSDYVMSGTLINLMFPPRSDSNVLATYPYSLSGGGFSWMETPAGVVDGSNNVFTLSNIPVAGALMLYVDGVLMRPGALNDYIIAGTTITFAFMPKASANILASYPY